MPQPSTVAFVVASGGRDAYSARTLVAIASLRVSNPRVRVVIACDRDTDTSLREAGDPLVSQADSWMTVDAPPGDAAFHSRFVKTRLRSLIDGPFLYLDSDVFVRGPLDEVFALDCDIAGAPNHSRDVFSEQVWDQDRTMLEHMGWEIGSEVYINGGVLFWNDTVGARRLAEEWHWRWTLSSSSQGSIRDQPAFNSALIAADPKLAVLPHRFNAQVFTSPTVAVNAVIWHFYAADQSRIPERYNALLREVLRTGTVDPDAIQTLVSDRDPWSLPDLEVVLTRNVSLLDQIFPLQSELSVQRAHLLAIQEELRGTQSELHDAQAGVLAAKQELRVAQANEHAMRLELLATRETESTARAELLAIRQEVLAGLGELTRTKALLDQILASKSWRLTRPLRAIDALARRLFGEVSADGGEALRGSQRRQP